MALPTISIIIPTRNRPQILRKCLDCITKQTIRNQLEVIVVIDGEDPRTAEMLASLRWSFPLICFAIPKAQQGVARNRGVAHAHGEIILFIGDDIFLAPDACERHIRAHGQKAPTPDPSPLRGGGEPPLSRSMGEGAGGWGPTAVLGFTTWDPALPITPVMRWLESTGWQFGYAQIAEYAGGHLPPHLQHRFTYTSHISLPRETARVIPFRENVTLYGWEDIEWGIRLRDAGVSLVYEPAARALHHHTITLKDSLKRMETLGESAQVFAGLHQRFDRVPRGWKFLVYHLLALLPTLRGKHAKAFLRGLKKP